MQEGAEEVRISFSSTEDLSSYRPVQYDVLPRVIADKVDSTVASIFDHERGRIVVFGNPKVGKTMLIHQIIDSAKKEGKDRNLASIMFIHMDSESFESVAEIGVDRYVYTLCSAYNVSEYELCFVTENPDIAATFGQGNSRVRIILETSTATFSKMMEMENAGASKVWGSWEFLDADELTLTRKEISSLVVATSKESIKESTGVDLTKKIVEDFINYCVKKNPDLMIREGQDRNRIVVPFGVWAVVIRRMCGTIGFNKSPKIRYNGKISMNRVMGLTYDTEGEFLNDFTENSSGDDGTLLSLGPDGPIIRFMSPGVDGDTGDDDMITPPEKIEPLDFNSLDALKENLYGEILGQDEALDTIIKKLTTPMAGLNRKDTPLATFLFCGPTGTGKTQTAITLAQSLAKEPMPLVRIDMSEFSEKHEASKLLGAAPGYVGYEQGGVLTNAVMRNPHSIILLDEIEKAHPSIWDSFLQVLHPGRMTDAKGRVADFTQSVIIMTSNLGAAEISKTPSGFSALNDDALYLERQKTSKNTVKTAVEKTFRPEFVNRMKNIVFFKELSQDTARRIVRKELSELDGILREGSNLMLSEVSDDIVDAILVESNVQRYGAREVQKTVEETVTEKIAYCILHGEANLDGDTENSSKKSKGKRKSGNTTARDNIAGEILLGLDQGKITVSILKKG